MTPMSQNELAPPEHGPDLQGRVQESILNLVLSPPVSSKSESRDPLVAANSIKQSAARQASLLAGSLALPPGMLGWLTVLPELVGVWRLQAQMVSDIAAVYGKNATLGREQMLYCLFRHVSAQLVRDVAVRVGERYVVQRVSRSALESIARTLGVKVTQTLVGKGAARMVPLIGAAGVSAYAYYDTRQVAKTAIELFSAPAGDS